MIGGAIDKRIDAVISSSSGAGGVNTFRSFSEPEFGESIEILSRRFPTWVHPGLRFFVGREHKLPVDMPNLIATVAPRPFLFAHALNDNVESTWDLEHSWRSAKRVYDLFHASENINLLYRAGTHESRAEDSHTGGLARWSEQYPFQPWLSEFIGYETRVPYDYHEVLAAVAPRKVAVIAPKIDRQATNEEVLLAVEEASGVFELSGSEDHLLLSLPDDYNQLGPEMLQVINEQLRLLLDKNRE